YVGIDREFSRQFPSHFCANLADVNPSDHAIRARKINVFEHAKSRPLIREWPFRAQSVFVDDQYLARLDFADELRMDEIKSARLKSQDVSVMEFAQGKGTPAKRIAPPDQFAFTHDDKRERSLDSSQRRKNIPAIFRGLRQEMQNDF